MFSQECKKLFFKKKLLWLLLALLLAKTASSFLSAGGLSLFPDPEQSKVYEAYMDILRGPLTEQKEEYILREKEKYVASEQNLQAAAQQITDGAITGAQYDEIVARESALRQTAPVMEHIYQQYQYVAKAPQSRFFVDPPGWMRLLTAEQPDYLLLFGVLILCATAFHCESDSGMSALNLTAPKGRRRLCAVKLTLCTASCFALLLGFLAADLLPLAASGVLRGASFPAGSLPYFAQGAKDTRLLPLLIQLTGLRFFGYLYFALCVFCAAIFIKSMIFTVFSNLTLSVLPLFLFSGEGFFYRLPLPIGLMIGSGYFRGTKSFTMSEGEPLVLFRAMDGGEFGLLLITASLLVAGLIAAVLLGYSPGKRARKMPPKLFLALPMVFCVFFGGCDTSQKTSAEAIVYNRNASYVFYDAGRYMFLNADQPYFYDKQTGAVRRLLLDPLEQFASRDAAQIGNTKKLFVSAGNAYILENAPADPQGKREASFTVDAVSLDDFQKNTVLAVGNARKANGFLGLSGLFPPGGISVGLFAEDGAVTSSYMGPYADTFFVTGDTLYTVENNRLFSRKFSGGSGRAVTEQIIAANQISCDGENIYWINLARDLYRYSIQGGKLERITEYKADRLYITSAEIYFTNLFDHGSLYRYDLQSGRTEKILEEQTFELCAAGDFVYYKNAEGKLYRMRPDGTDSAAVLDFPVGTYHADGEDVYYETTETADGETVNVYYRMDQNGVKEKLILAIQ